jgi:hypothetical protein
MPTLLLNNKNNLNAVQLSIRYDDALSKIIELHNRMKQSGQAKCDSATDKQGDGKDIKKG